MTPLYSLWLASVAGALLFFAAGFFLARRPHQAAGDRRPDRPAGAHSQYEILVQAAAVDAVIPPRVPPPAVESPLSTAAADPLDPPSVTALRAQVNELRNALREVRVREQGQADAERELLRLRGDRSELEQKARREIAIELEATRRRLADLEQVRDENAALRQQAAGSAAVAEKLARAESELRDLRSRGLAAAAPPRLPRASASPVRPTGDPRSTSEQLTGLLTRLRGKGMRTIALADDLGLPIVGLGDELSQLAAFAGYLTEIGRKARDFLPMGPLRRVTVEDENEGTVTACPLVAGDARIALVTLTMGPGPTARQMGDVLRSAASMVR